MHGTSSGRLRGAIMTPQSLRGAPLATLRSAELSEAERSISRPGALLLLVGEPGAGKHVLARQLLASIPEPRPAVVVLNASPTIQPIPFALIRTVLPHQEQTEALDAAAGYSAVVAAWPQQHPGTVILVDDADSADDLSLQVIAALCGTPGYRVIITARDLSALPLPVLQLLREQPASIVEFTPLTLPQSTALINHLLSPGMVEAETGTRIHRATLGNPLHITELVASLLRSGALMHFDGLFSWSGGDEATMSLPDFLINELSRATPEIRSALLTVALAEPIPLSALARLGDIASPAAIDELLAHRVLRSDTAADGTPLVCTSNQLIGETVRQATPPGERITLLQRIADTLPGDLELSPAETLLRSTSVLLDAGRIPSPEILWSALTAARATNSYRLTARIGRILGSDATQSEQQRIVATTARLTAARLSGLPTLLDEADLLRAPVPRDRPSQPHSLGDPMISLVPTPGDSPDTLLSRIDLGFARADVLLYRDDDVSGATKILDGLLDAYPDPDSPAHLHVVAGSYIRLAYAGKFAAARGLRLAPGAPARAPEVIPVAGADILIAGQAGRLRELRAVARHALPAALSRSGTYPTAGGEIFGALFMSEILNGQVKSAERLHRALLRAVAHPTAAYREGTGLVGVVTGTLALAQGRWGDAAAEFAASADALSRNDGSGFLPVSLAGSALALAASGRAEHAWEAIALLEQTPLRASRIVEGPIRLAAVAARFWLNDPGARDAADALARWARERALHLVELRAIHLAGAALVPLPSGACERAEALHQAIGTQFSGSLCSAILERRGGGPVQDSAAGRQLARHGVLSPLRWREPLTPREREVGGLAVLGYSTKLIAATLRISTRTVETHLARIFTKLGINDREGLAISLEQRSGLWEPTQSSVLPENTALADK